MDAKEALQYVYTLTLSADQPGGVGKEQVEASWELVRRVIVLANADAGGGTGGGGPAWEELVGGVRSDGSKFVSICAFPDFF